MLTAAVLLAVGALYLLLLVAVAIVMVYPFRVPIFTAPGMMGHRQESVRFVTEDGVELKGWWVPVEGATVVVFCHGYLVNRSEFVPLTHLFAARGASCLFFDFRAHGWSGGRKSLFGAVEHLDVAAAVGWARARRPDARVVVFGASMGAAAAVLAVSRGSAKVDALILDSVYSNLDEATKGWWSYLGQGRLRLLLAPVSLVGRLIAGLDPKRVRTGPALSAVAGLPILLMFGTRDPLCPLESAERLVRAAGPRARAAWFPGSGHTEGRFHAPDRFLEEVFDFLDSHGLL